ncbi:hypothetical protein D3C81_2150960 [compost metagenome]
MTAVIRGAVSDPQALQDRAPLVVQIRGLFDMLTILPRREDERRFGELPFALPAALRVLLGELQGMQRPVVE